MSLIFFKDQIIIPLSKTGLTGRDEESQEEDPLLVVHPNYIIDAWTLSQSLLQPQIWYHTDF